MYAKPNAKKAAYEAERANRIAERKRAEDRERRAAENAEKDRALRAQLILKGDLIPRVA